MALIDAPRHAMLYCRECDTVHLFHLRGWGASYYGDCVETAMPESLLNQALGAQISIHTLLAVYSSVVEGGVENLLLPKSAFPWLYPLDRVEIA